MAADKSKKDAKTNKGTDEVTESAPAAAAKPAPPARLKEKYNNEIRAQLKEELGLTNIMQVPKLEKITINMGVGEAKQDKKLLAAALQQLGAIAGQQPSVRLARKSIATYKLRDGMPVGVAVTLRDARMYEFLDRVISIAIPRIRDFRGMKSKLDGRGNYTFGVTEQIIFPEIDYDAIDMIRGMDITFTTTAVNDEQGRALLMAFGFPFKRDKQQQEQAEAA